MSIVVTGASGKLGRHVVAALLSRGVPASELVATARNTDAIADLGVPTRHADYDDPASLAAAFAGATKLLLVSGNEVGSRAQQHRNVIAAAKDAGVQLVAYTSIVKADTGTTLLAHEHLGTERDLAASGLPFVLLRNSWYHENYLAQLDTFLEHGIAGAAGSGQVSAASRRDYAEAAAAVLTEDGHAGAVYELGGAAYTLTELAAEISAATGTTVTYTDLPQQAYEQVLVGAGLPQPVAAMLADADRGLSQGELFTDSTDLEKLIGRPATSLRDAVAAAVSGRAGGR